MEGASLTARVAAAYRARATARPVPLCSDIWAQYLVGDGAEDLLRKGDSVAPEMEDGIAVRTAWLDGAVNAWTGPQLVLLGAGLDTRPARLARPNLRFFEVDHPETQRYKRNRLSVVSGYPLDASTLVPCDFERDDFASALRAAGFQADVASAFVWEGVTAYLTESAVRATFRAVAGLGAQAIYFDYIGPAPVADGVAAFASDRGEPFLFTVKDIEPLARSEGFRTTAIVSMKDAHAKYGRPIEVAPFFERWFLAESRI